MTTPSADRLYPFAPQLYTPQQSLAHGVAEPSMQEYGFLTPPRPARHPDIRILPGRSPTMTPLTIAITVSLPASSDQSVPPTRSTVVPAVIDDHKAEPPIEDVPRDIPGHRRISGRQRGERGVQFGMRDLVATLFAAAVRVLVGGGVMRLRDPSSVVTLLGLISAAHIGICLWIYSRIGPVVADSTREAQEERLVATRWAKIVTVSTACAAATMVPMVYAVQRANDEDGTDGVQSAMLYATGLIAQSAANPVRDLIVFLSKSSLPPTTLELSDPRSSDTRRQIHERIEQCKRLVVLLSTISYAGLLYGTGVLADYAKAKQTNWIGDAGSDEFPDIDAWRNAFMIDSAVYVFVETLDQWSMQLIASAVQHVQGVSQYLRTDEIIPVTPLDPAAVPDMHGEALITPLNGIPAAFAEFLLSSTVRSNLVYACGIPSALLHNNVMRSSQADGFNESQSLWRQVLRGPLAFAEFRNWLYQMVSKCSLTSLPNNDSSNAPRAGGSEEIREAVANRTNASYPFAVAPDPSPPVSQSVMRRRTQEISPLRIPGRPSQRGIAMQTDSKHAVPSGHLQPLSVTPSSSPPASQQSSSHLVQQASVARHLVAPFEMANWDTGQNSYPFLQSSPSPSATPQHSPVDNKVDDRF